MEKILFLKAKYFVVEMKNMFKEQCALIVRFPRQFSESSHLVVVCGWKAYWKYNHQLNLTIPTGGTAAVCCYSTGKIETLSDNYRINQDYNQALKAGNLTEFCVCKCKTKQTM